MDGSEIGRATQSGNRVAALLASGARKLRIAFADMCQRQAWRGQFDSWTRHREIDSVLEALGLERGQIPVFLKGIPAAARLLPAMMARIGAAGRSGIKAPLRQDLLRVCALCHHQARCQEWLDSGATTGFEEFCPNASAFAATRPVKRRSGIERAALRRRAPAPRHNAN